MPKSVKGDIVAKRVDIRYKRIIGRVNSKAGIKELLQLYGEYRELVKTSNATQSTKNSQQITSSTSTA